MSFVIAPYPLSSPFRRRLASALGEEEPSVLAIGELRRLSRRRLLGELRRHRGRRCLIALEDDAAEPLVPILAVLAIAAGASGVETVDRELTRVPLSRAKSLWRLVDVGLASVDGNRALRRARRTLEELARAPRQRVALTGHEVLYLNAQLWYGVKAGGSVAHVAGVANGLLDAGYDLTYASLSEPQLLHERAVFERLTAPRVFGLPPEINYLRIQPWIARQATALVRARPRSLLYQRLATFGYAGTVTAREANIPYVLEYNGSEVWIARNWGRPLQYEEVALAAEDAALRHAHVIVTVSDVLADELRARGVEDDRIVVYPNGVDANAFDPAHFRPEDRQAVRERAQLPADAFVIGFIGTFGEWHGVDVLARSIRRLYESRRTWLEANNVWFLLVGDGLRMGEVREILGDSDERVVLPGLVPQRDAPAFLAAMDALVSPHVPNRDGSRFFGSPTKLFEYMAMGRPIVASRLEQLAEILQPALDARALPDGQPSQAALEVAVLTRPGDVNELVGALEFVVEHPEWSARLGANARARVLEQHTWGHHVRAILAGLDRALTISG